MGTLFSSLDIGRSGMQVAQVQMDISAHNISNVNTEGFSRQRATLLDRAPIHRPYGSLGRGVQIGNVERIRDIFLDGVYRGHVPGLGEAEVMAEYFSRIEDIFLEPGDNGLGIRINLFFDALNDFANNVEQVPVRQAVLSEGDALASTLNEAVNRLYLLQTNSNEEVKNQVAEINSITERIASLNIEIRDTELGGLRSANDLRDERDLLLDDLAQLVNINIRERTDGQVDVLIASDMLINGDRSRELEAVTNAALHPERNDLVEVRYLDNSLLVDVREGSLFGALEIRDTHIVEIDGRLDEIAATIIEQINLIHGSGNGLDNISGIISSTNLTTDAVTALDSAGLPFQVVDGSFDVVIYDASDNIIATKAIAIDADVTTLTDIQNALNTPPPPPADFSATITGGNTLDISVTAPYTFAFSNDTSGTLTALGINNFFDGYDARTMSLNTDIADHPEWISSGYSTNVADTGDNRAALDLADVRNGLYLESNTSTINDAYESAIVWLGVNGRSTLEKRDLENAFIETFERRRMEVSGVSLDEEVVFMIQYQRAFEASARIISVVDRMLETVVNLGR